MNITCLFISVPEDHGARFRELSPRGKSLWQISQCELAVLYGHHEMANCASRWLWKYGGLESYSIEFKGEVSVSNSGCTKCVELKLWWRYHIVIYQMRCNEGGLSPSEWLTSYRDSQARVVFQLLLYQRLNAGVKTVMSVLIILQNLQQMTLNFWLLCYKQKHIL